MHAYHWVCHGIGETDPFQALLVPLNKDASPAFHGNAPPRTIVAVYAALIGSLVNACVLHLANIGMDTAIERDWSVHISRWSSSSDVSIG